MLSKYASTCSPPCWHRIWLTVIPIHCKVIGDYEYTSDGSLTTTGFQASQSVSAMGPISLSISPEIALPAMTVGAICSDKDIDCEEARRRGNLVVRGSCVALIQPRTEPFQPTPMDQEYPFFLYYAFIRKVDCHGHSPAPRQRICIAT